MPLPSSFPLGPLPLSTYPRALLSCGCHLFADGSRLFLSGWNSLSLSSYDTKATQTGCVSPPVPPLSKGCHHPIFPGTWARAQESPRTLPSSLLCPALPTPTHCSRSFRPHPLTASSRGSRPPDTLPVHPNAARASSTKHTLDPLTPSVETKCSQGCVMAETRTQPAVSELPVAWPSHPLSPTSLPVQPPSLPPLTQIPPSGPWPALAFLPSPLGLFLLLFP